MLDDRPSALVFVGLLIAGPVSMAAGLIWFLTPNVISFPGAYVQLVEHPNWRGLPLLALAAILWVLAGIVLRRERVLKVRVAALIGSLIIAFLLVIAGLVLFFTPILEVGGVDAVGIQTGTPMSLPAIGLAVAFWIAGGALALDPAISGSKVKVSIGLLAAGPVAMVLVEFAHALAAGSGWPGWAVLIGPEQVAVAGLWMLAPLVLLPELRRGLAPSYRPEESQGFPQR